MHKSKHCRGTYYVARLEPGLLFSAHPRGLWAPSYQLSSPPEILVSPDWQSKRNCALSLSRKSTDTGLVVIRSLEELPDQYPQGCCGCFIKSSFCYKSVRLLKACSTLSCITSFGQMTQSCSSVPRSVELSVFKNKFSIHAGKLTNE